MRHCIVTTTINVPTNLEAYAKDAADFGYAKDTQIVIAGDKKTPQDIRLFCDKVSKKYGVPMVYLGPTAQDSFLEKWPAYKSFLPWNCIQRRNVALLYAYHNGAEIIYTLDDDNYLETKNYITHHAIGRREMMALSSYNKWLNVCLFLKDRNNALFYPRGFSFSYRGAADPVVREHSVRGRCVVNAGLWLGAPDIDAVTRMAINPEVMEIWGKRTITLAKDTKCPFNSQNTALHRDVIPAYCMASGVGRYDDIAASYIVKRIADHLGDYISFGLPLVKQDRNQHDNFVDLAGEMLGMKSIDGFVYYLWEQKLSGTTYKFCAQELIDGMKGSKDEFCAAVAQSYQFWLDCF